MIHPYALAALIAAPVIFSAGWQTNQWKNDADKKQAIEQAALDQQELRRLEQARSRAALDAQNMARTREIVLRRDADAARTELVRLRTATQQATDNARADPQACPDTAVALGVVFDQCSAELTTLARDADRHVSDIRTLLASP